MGWGNAAKSGAAAASPLVLSSKVNRAPIVPAKVDRSRLVTLDFETYYDDQYTLRKLSTSEYVRDPRFKAQMVGIKIGDKPTKVYTGKAIKRAIQSIPWETHSLLAHHAQFDGLVLYEHFGVSPKKIYCTLSMFRGLHNNDAGAGLDEASQFYGGPGKTHAEALEQTKGVQNWPKELIATVAPYCAGDVDECYRIFWLMHAKMPWEEIDLIDITCRMFTEPVLKVDIPRVSAEHDREVAEKKRIMLSFVKDADAFGIKLAKADLTKLAKAEEIDPEQLTEETINVLRVKRLINSDKFADLLKAEGVDPPVKISPAYFKHRDESRKWTWAFAKTDLDFIALQEHASPRVRALVEARLSVKSTTNETRARRFMVAGQDERSLPVYLKYAAAHTLRWGGGDKMNMQNLKRGGELRRSILADKGHVICVKDSGQIEARVNAWLWGQDDLVNDFRLADAKMDKDAYCKFADIVYGREITKADELERFVGKVCVLALGYQMGAPRLQKTLALGSMGPPVFLSDDECKRIVYAYRRKNFHIKNGWAIYQQIIEQMAAGIPGSYKCISWDHETLHLPNGMSMHYPNLHDSRIEKMVAARLKGNDAYADELDGMDMPQYVYERKGTENKIYGGLLCENIVQALARIIVADQMRRIAAAGWRVVMMTHDEVATHVKNRQAARCDKQMQQIMMTPLPWCMDLPLNAEGGYDTFYSK